MHHATLTAGLLPLVLKEEGACVCPVPVLGYPCVLSWSERCPEVGQTGRAQLEARFWPQTRLRGVSLDAQPQVGVCGLWGELSLRSHLQHHPNPRDGSFSSVTEPSPTRAIPGSRGRYFRPGNTPCMRSIPWPGDAGVVFLVTLLSRRVAPAPASR